MSASPFDILFEPVQIGPVTAKNRFYQVPHCTGSGALRPRIQAHMREVKAEGGWGVVNTEYCSVHPSSDDLPYVSATLWDDRDIKAHAEMTEKVHAHGALAGVELMLGGARMANLDTREVPLSAGNLPNLAGNPFQSRAMDLSDIRDARRWHRDAALRAKTAGFDLVYVYATHGYLLSQFLSKTTNHRGDAYGGALENRVRLLREIIEDTKDAVGDTMAVAVRFSAETNGGGGADGAPIPGETEDMFGLLAELPDLWDINIEDYSYEMGLSRFTPEAALEPYVAGIKSLTSKPVVSVGRFTSPDTMASQVRRGVLDLIGAARPSIADPFLPNKIREGRLEDIRECIGCNICYTGDGKGVPIRCTQNPTMSEEWRRGWHPERMNAKRSDDTVLIVGAGPTGLEAAHALGKRGYNVMLAEATRVLGGRVTQEARLPGLTQWARVRDYRLQQIDKLPNVEVFRESALTAEQVFEIAPDHVAIATGATWRRDGYGANALAGIAGLGPAAPIFTPDDIMAGRLPEGRVVVYDDDHYYMGTVVAELLRLKGCAVTLMTPEDLVSTWGAYTYDRWRAQARLLELGVQLSVARSLRSFDGARVVSGCTYTGRETEVAADDLVLVTARQPKDALYRQILEYPLHTSDGPLKSVAKIGDCDAPAIIAAAVFAGHRYARALEADVDRDAPLRHDRVYS
ncbi:Histamine dehydrogenase [Candidatus Rhodobacter oscarellae]|uniref:Histamine dehydrogenase n=1 Tax=Candidatus Rhodobacter oscarellae TaxID=1675527 RepID=A0A0J9EEW2_9RHOB|nr:FAD-dependent oxidoreductase [Candidatus Rhodobacter lobularis]KMW60224.1 Histamine dehydrogenase [Candidatus Rhodobacter lobularis]